MKDNKIETIKLLPQNSETTFYLTTVLLMFAIFYLTPVVAIKYVLIAAVGFSIVTSKNIIPWLAIYFFVSDNVFGLFTETTREALAQTGPPLITLGVGFSTGLTDIMLMSFIFRALLKTNIRFSRNTQVLILIILLSAIVVGGVIYNTSLSAIITNVLRGYMNLLIFYVISKEIGTDGIFRLLHLISLPLLLVVFDQGYAAVTGTRILQQVLGLNLSVAFFGEGMGIRSSPYGHNTVLFSFIYALLVLSLKIRKDLPRASTIYASLLIAFCLVSVVLASTRNVIALYLIIIILSTRKLLLRFRTIAIALAIILLVIYGFNSLGLDVTNYIRISLYRFSGTLNPALQGKDLGDIDLSGRQSEIPKILDGIKRSPLIGYGLSERARFYLNNNFGILNTVLIFGIIGAMIILGIILIWIAEIRQLSRQTTEYRSALARLIYATLVGMLVGYLTTYDHFTTATGLVSIKLTFLMGFSAVLFSEQRNSVQNQQTARTELISIGVSR